MSFATRKSDTHEERYVHADVNGIKTFKASAFCRLEVGGWRVSFAYCSREDAHLYSRKKGRGVARRRYFQGQHALLGPSFDPGVVARIAELEAP